MEILGYLASVGTSFFFSTSSIFFTFAGRKVGSPTVNRIRLLLAFLVIITLHTLAYGMPLPINAEPFRWVMLGISGFIGLVLGDAFLFQAYVMIGPRLSLLLLSLAPVLTVILAWLFLNERLEAQELLGIALAISGIAYVVSDSKAGNESAVAKPGSREYVIGILFGLGGAIGQAVGLIFSKVGLEGDFPPLSGNVIRLTSAVICMWVATLVMGQAVSTFRKMKEQPDALKYILAGALMGPTLAVTMGLYSVQLIPTGIASTLQSLMPIFLIPISYFFFKESPTRRGIIGTMIALVGTAILFL